MPSVPAASPPAALVTGGARRIGRAIVLALARAGYAVAIHANRSLKAAAELRDNIARDGGRASVVAADLADHDEVPGILPAAVPAAGPLTPPATTPPQLHPPDIPPLAPHPLLHHF